MGTSAIFLTGRSPVLSDISTMASDPNAAFARCRLHLNVAGKKNNKKPFPLENGVGESALSWLPGDGLSMRDEGTAFLITQESKGRCHPPAPSLHVSPTP